MLDGYDEWPTGRLLSTAARLVEQSWESLLRNKNLTHAGLIALHTVLETDSSQRDIAKACRVTDQTMSRTLERLSREGFITRHTDPSDERRTVVRITSAGRAVYREVSDLERSDAMLTSGVSDHGALREQLLELVRGIGGADRAE